METNRKRVVTDEDDYTTLSRPTFRDPDPYGRGDVLANPRPTRV